MTRCQNSKIAIKCEIRFDSYHRLLGSAENRGKKMPKIAANSRKNHGIEFLSILSLKRHSFGLLSELVFMTICSASCSNSWLLSSCFHNLCLWCHLTFVGNFVLLLFCPEILPSIMSRSSESCLKMCPIHLSLWCHTGFKIGYRSSHILLYFL